MSESEWEAAVRQGGGVVARRQRPELAGSLDWALRRGQLVAVLPGVYAPPERAAMPLTRMRGVSLAHPDGVLTGAAAARVSFWPGAPLDEVEVAVPGRVSPQPGFRFVRRRIPPELTVSTSGWRYTAPALTAIDLATVECADAIDVALRSRRATLSGMYAALSSTPHRPGNAERLALLLDSRDEPWSEAERRGHRILRQARITGWRANLPVVIRGQRYYLDIGFARQRLAVEIDGRIHECDHELFESDRWRQNALVLSGWRVLRYTWSMLVNHPDVVSADVLAALKSSRRNVGDAAGVRL